MSFLCSSTVRSSHDSLPDSMHTTPRLKLMLRQTSSRFLCFDFHSAAWSLQSFSPFGKSCSCDLAQRSLESIDSLQAFAVLRRRLVAMTIRKAILPPVEVRITEEVPGMELAVSCVKYLNCSSVYLPSFPLTPLTKAFSAVCPVGKMTCSTWGGSSVHPTAYS